MELIEKIKNIYFFKQRKSCNRFSVIEFFLILTLNINLKPRCGASVFFILIEYKKS